jgi:hypothetical protein
MQWQDATLLGRKVLVAIALTVVPLLILWGGLGLTERVLTAGRHGQPASQTK